MGSSCPSVYSSAYFIPETVQWIVIKVDIGIGHPEDGGGEVFRSFRGSTTSLDGVAIQKTTSCIFYSMNTSDLAYIVKSSTSILFWFVSVNYEFHFTGN
jgi:hypothetical protein